MKLLNWKRKECCDCKKKMAVVEKALVESCEAQVDIVTQLRRALEQIEARLKKLEAKKKSAPKKKRPQPVFKRKHN